MRNVSILLMSAWLVMSAGCSDKTQEIETSGATQTLVGEAYYRERIMLPPGAELHVTLEDVSKMDVASTVLAASRLNSVEYRFLRVMLHLLNALSR